MLHSDLAKASTRLFVQLAQAAVHEALDFQREQQQNRQKQTAAQQVVTGMAEMLKIANALPSESALVKEHCQDLLNRQSRAQAELTLLTESAQRLAQQSNTLISRVTGIKDAVIQEVNDTLQAVMDTGLAAQ